MRSSSLAFPLASCMVAMSLVSSRVQASVPRAILQPAASSCDARPTNCASGPVQHASSIGTSSSPSLDEISPNEKKRESRAILSKAAYTTLAAYTMGVSAVVCQNRYDCFVNVMTGHIISLVTAVTELQWRDVVHHASLLTGFGSGVALFRAVDINIKKKFELHSSGAVPSTLKPLSPSNAVVAAPLVLVLLCIADIAFALSHRNTAFSSKVLGSVLNNLHLPILSLAFGFCNAAASDATGGVITFAMTGHSTAVFRSLAEGGIVGKACTSAKALAGFTSGIASASLAANLLKGRVRSIPVPLFSCLGVIFSLLLILRSNPEDLQTAARILFARPSNYTTPAVDVYVRQSNNDVSHPFVSCTMMDGWTRLPSGPAPFQDGS